MKSLKILLESISGHKDKLVTLELWSAATSMGSLPIHSITPPTNYDQPTHQGCRFRAVKAVQGDHDPRHNGEDAFFSLDMRVLGPSLNKGHAFPGNIL